MLCHNDARYVSGVVKDLILLSPARKMSIWQRRGLLPFLPLPLMLGRSTRPARHGRALVRVRVLFSSSFVMFA